MFDGYLQLYLPASCPKFTPISSSALTVFLAPVHTAQQPQKPFSFPSKAQGTDDLCPDNLFATRIQHKASTAQCSFSPPRYSPETAPISPSAGGEARSLPQTSKKMILLTKNQRHSTLAAIRLDSTRIGAVPLAWVGSSEQRLSGPTYGATDRPGSHLPPKVRQTPRTQSYHRLKHKWQVLSSSSIHISSLKIRILSTISKRKLFLSGFATRPTQNCTQEGKTAFSPKPHIFTAFHQFWILCYLLQFNFLRFFPISKQTETLL